MPNYLKCPTQKVSVLNSPRACLSQKRHDRRMADCLVPDSQPEQNVPLVVIAPTTPGFKLTLSFKNVKS